MILEINVQRPYLFERERERERERVRRLGGLPERHLAHQSWPPIATIYCKYTVTKLYSQCVTT